jgi:TolA-binding protein
MKAKERHHLKQNEFAESAMRAIAAVDANRGRATQIGLAVLAVVAVGAWFFYAGQRTNENAGRLLGVAMAIADAPIATASTLPGAGQQLGTYPSEEARREAALEAFGAAADGYPDTQAGIAARYHYGTVLLAAGRPGDADLAFGDVSDRAGASLYGVLARMGRAESLLAREDYDSAIGMLTDLAADRTGVLPVDGILMQLARASLEAGRTEEARAAFRRVVDEFPASAYAAEARERLARIG